MQHMGITIYDDYLVLFCDVHIIFVTKYKAKFLSLATYDEDKHLVIECYHSMTKLSSVTRKRSQKIIFLLVSASVPCTPSQPSAPCPIDAPPPRLQCPSCLRLAFQPRAAHRSVELAAGSFSNRRHGVPPEEAAATSNFARSS
jgi:hypothetical protein